MIIVNRYTQIMIDEPDPKMLGIKIEKVSWQ